MGDRATWLLLLGSLHRSSIVPTGTETTVMSLNRINKS